MDDGLLMVAQRVVETLGGGAQPDLLGARRMQALPLAVHIPLVCSAGRVILVPALVLLYTRILGTASLFGSFVSGVLAIAGPEALGAQGED